MWSYTIWFIRFQCSMKQRFMQKYYTILATLAKKYIQKHAPYIIGINGSIWKTSCRMILAQTLKKTIPQTYRIYTSPKNFNGELWMSLSIFCIETWKPTVAYALSTLWRCFVQLYSSQSRYDCIIIEYGIDRPKEMEFLLDIAKPHMWIFTKMDSVHSEQFGNPQAIAQEEAKMIENTREIAFLNNDDIYARQLYSMISVDKFLYSTTHGDSAVYAEASHIDYDNYKLKKDKKDIVSAIFRAKNNTQHVEVKTNLIWRENFWYISLSLAIADIMYYKVTQQSLYENLKKVQKKDTIWLHCRYKLQAGRLSIFEWIHQSILLDSSYNASPLSMRKVIETSFTLKKELFPDHKILFVMWDMRELWTFTESEHRKVAWPLYMVADHILLVGPYSNAHTYDELCKIGMWETLIFSFKNAAQAASHVKHVVEDSTNKRIIVCKWSQNGIYLEEVIKKMLPKKERKHHHHYLCRQSDDRMKKKEAFFAETKKKK